jgi:hypothetical protein
MRKTLVAGSITLLLVASLLGGLGVTPAGAVTHYANCTALHRAHPYGVAKSRRAANKQVNTGHYRPYVSLTLYNANSSLDADKDGTACEVSR